MARLERRTLTRWEDGVVKTYQRGDDVPDLKPSGVSGVFLTQAERGKVAGRPDRKSAKTAGPATQATSQQPASADLDLDIVELLEGNVRDVVSHIDTESRISVLEDILVAEGEGKNRSTVTSAINERIKQLEEEG